MEASWIGEPIWTMEKPMRKYSIVSGAWGRGLMGNDFIQYLCVLQNQPPAVFWIPFSLLAQPSLVGIIPAISPSLLIPS